jgi:3-phosphoshikimate 1-carboxyvinyltransferase
MHDGPVTLTPAGPVHARLAAPSSKSYTNRALVVAALAQGESLLRRPLASDDTARMSDCLRRLGATVEDEGEAWRVSGTGGRFQAPDAPLDAGLSGTTSRFLTAILPLVPGEVTLTGRGRLLERPIGPLTAALRFLGARVDDRGGCPPVTARGGGLPGGEVTLDATLSSQFVTALLLAAPYSEQGVTLHVHNLGAGAFVDMTLQLMRQWGVTVEQPDAVTWRVSGGQRYGARNYTVEYDASAACHLFALAMATGGRVTVTNATPDTLQPDAGLVYVFERMGGAVTREGEALTVTGPETPRPVDVDLGGMPDQVMTVATLAALAPGTSVIRNVAVTRTHETDRLAATAAELAKLGIRVEETPDSLTVHGGSPRGPASIATYHDHRMAMAFAALAARVPGLAIEDPGCVAKTYPRFWENLRAAGVRFEGRGMGDEG